MEWPPVPKSNATYQLAACRTKTLLLTPPETIVSATAPRALHISALVELLVRLHSVANTDTLCPLLTTIRSSTFHGDYATSYLAWLNVSYSNSDITVLGQLKGKVEGSTIIDPARE